MNTACLTQGWPVVSVSPDSAWCHSSPPCVLGNRMSLLPPARGPYNTTGGVSPGPCLPPSCLVETRNIRFPGLGRTSTSDSCAESVTTATMQYFTTAQEHTPGRAPSPSPSVQTMTEVCTPHTPATICSHSQIQDAMANAFVYILGRRFSSQSDCYPMPADEEEIRRLGRSQFPLMGAHY